jgi:hypothetical protein
MGKNYKIFETGIDVSAIAKEVAEHSDDWRGVATMDNVVNDDWKTTVLPALPLIIGVATELDAVYDSDAVRVTPFFKNYPAMIEFIKSRGFRNLNRCGFLCLPVGGKNGFHTEEGKYYENKDRYHLSIQGRYQYFVDDEEFTVEPGTFFWFDDKKMHSAINIGTCDRISFVWDAPMNERHLVSGWHNLNEQEKKI